jgi:Eukaryotic protein of unknown function (DUF953)
MWKNPSNPFRHDIYVNLRTVPTMLRWDNPRKRLEGDDFLYDIELDWFFHVKTKEEEENIE